MAEEDIQPGEQWSERIRHAIERSDHVVVLWTPAAAASQWVHHEYRSAIEGGIPVLPVVAGGLSRKDLPSALESLQAPMLTGTSAPAVQQISGLIRDAVIAVAAQSSRARRRRGTVLVAMLIIVGVAAAVGWASRSPAPAQGTWRAGRTASSVPVAPISTVGRLAPLPRPAPTRTTKPTSTPTPGSTATATGTQVAKPSPPAHTAEPVITFRP
jgi:hypothetical protein